MSHLWGHNELFEKLASKAKDTDARPQQPSIPQSGGETLSQAMAKGIDEAFCHVGGLHEGPEELFAHPVDGDPPLTFRWGRSLALCRLSSWSRRRWSLSKEISGAAAASEGGRLAADGCRAMEYRYEGTVEPVWTLSSWRVKALRNPTGSGSFHEHPQSASVTSHVRSHCHILSLHYPLAFLWETRPVLEDICPWRSGYALLLGSSWLKSLRKTWNSQVVVRLKSAQEKLHAIDSALSFQACAGFIENAG